MSKHRRRVNVSRQQRTRDDPRLRPRAEIVAARQKRQQGASGPSLEGLLGLMIAFPGGYLAAESIMNDNRHPLHWLITVLAAALGYLVGHAIYRWKLRR